ncbi:MAG: PaaI family thioesterase, partial [Clostridia bacterium]|nr:PaaI family thioesterase [Clostridia bacterium]
MSTFKNVEEAREYFKKDKFATNSGILVEKLGEDSCVCSMEINENHINAIGGVMGGAIFTVADLA